MAPFKQALLAAFPLDDASLVLRFLHPLAKQDIQSLTVRLSSGLSTKKPRFDQSNPTRVVIPTGRMQSTPTTVDLARVGLKGIDRARASIRFAHGVLSPMELKVPNLDPTFPFGSTLAGVHVSIECCTGCNGGVHARDLVVLNSHIGGPWTGAWVQTAKTIEAPYPRWQKVRCAGGVVVERTGSTTVVDMGWMEVIKQFETPHHAPPPLPVDAADLPKAGDRSVLAKSLDGSWIQLSDTSVVKARRVEPQLKSDRHGLIKNEVVVADRSGGQAEVWFYQPSGLKLAVGDAVKSLRGFVHIERPGHWVILTDKEEDLIRG